MWSWISAPSALLMVAHPLYSPTQPSEVPSAPQTGTMGLVPLRKDHSPGPLLDTQPCYAFFCRKLRTVPHSAEVTVLFQTPRLHGCGTFTHMHCAGQCSAASSPIPTSLRTATPFFFSSKCSGTSSGKSFKSTLPLPYLIFSGALTSSA